MNKRYTVADFFCGAGGFSEGFTQAGFDVIFALDNWKVAIETHRLNHPECESVVMNILELNTPDKIDKNVPDTDIIIGSPPCVSFSNSNKSGKGDKTLGMELMKSYLRIILYKKSKPNSKLKYWLLENVENSKIFFGKKNVFTCSDLDLPEYNTTLIINKDCLSDFKNNIFNSYDYGTPQKRKRLIVGEFPTPKLSDNKFNINSVLSNLGNPLNNNSLSSKTIVDLIFNKIKLKREEITDHYYDTTIPEDMWKKSRKLKIDHGYMGKMSFPENINNPSRTIMATESYSTRESIILDKENVSGEYRGPTIRELACFMGFPINYIFTGNRNNKHKQIGNAVCVPLSYSFAIAIKEDLYIKQIEEEYKKRIEGFNSQNLNNLKKPIFDKYTVKPKKLNSKFHEHPPFLKVNSYRIELSNVDSDFDDNSFRWTSKIHKGAGKNSKNTEFKNENLIKYLESDNRFIEFRKTIDEKFKEIYCNELFQKKFCMIECQDNENHLSPNDSLDFISDEIKEISFDADEEFMEIEELDSLLENKNKKRYLYPLKILYSFYGVNKLCDLLSE